MEIASGLVLAVEYLVSSPEHVPQAHHEDVPLRQGGPPAYVAQGTTGPRYGYQEGREPIPDPVEYGRVDRYTPLSR